MIMKPSTSDNNNQTEGPGDQSLFSKSPTVGRLVGSDKHESDKIVVT